jgi:hypothetical protein
MVDLAATTSDEEMTSTKKVHATRRVLLVAAISISVVAPAAHAEPSEPARARALAMLREGNLLLERGRAAEALADFEEAYRTFASPKLHYNLGQAHAALAGHDVETYDQMTLFLDQVPEAGGELRAAAEKERSKRRAVIGLVSIQAVPADANLLLDGVPRGKASENTLRAVKPGEHTFALVRGDLVSAPSSMAVRAGETVSVTLRLESRADAVSMPLGVPSTAPGGPESAAMTTQRTVDVTAKPGDASKPLHRRPWFWGAVGGVVAAALVTTIVVTSSRERSWSNIPDINANAPQ